MPPVTRTIEPELVATIGAETEGPRWSISADLDEQTLVVRTLSPARPDPEHDHELWLLPAEGKAPISLGLLPDDGQARRRIPDQAAPSASEAKGIAVSREPEGGSPTGAPTGEVLFQGRFIRL